MKLNLFSIAIAIVSGCCGANAQLVYSNNFAVGGSGTIWNTAPTLATGFAGGSNITTWNDALGTNDSGSLSAGGLDSTLLGDSWLLPFHPQSGYVYTLNASLTFTGNPGGWVGFGFAQNDSVNVPVGYGRFADSGNGGPSGYDFMILTEANGNVQYFTGPKANAPSIFNGTGFTAGPQTLTAQVILDTTGGQWSVTGYVNGVQLSNSVAYTNFPAIGAVGLTQTTLTASNLVQWNYLTLSATPSAVATNTVNAIVSFSSTNHGLPLNPSFRGLSYEKLEVTTSLLTTNNPAIGRLFSLIGPAVLRIGGGTVDQTCWSGLSNTIPITPTEVDAFASFVNSLPANWSVIYGLNLLSNTPANCAAEASYAANALGSRLLGFEIGNEPESSFTSYSAFLARWRSLAAAVTNTVPGWAVTNGGVGWILADADAGQGVLSSYTDPFASDEAGIVSLLTQHYYRAAGGSTNDTIQLLLQPDTQVLLPLVTNIVGAAAGHCSQGARISECGSYSEGGVLGVSDSFGAALWSLDSMFLLALNGGQGINFHGGGKSPYSPLNDNGTTVTVVGSEFYGLKMLSLIPPGNAVPATLTLASNINLAAYGVLQSNGATSVLLNNKETNISAAVSVNLGSNVASAQVIELTAPSLASTNGFTLGGATINLDGSWSGGVQQLLPATSGQLTVFVPPVSALLLNPVFASPTLSYSLSGSQLNFTWPTNYTGWVLQSNSVSLAGANWFTVHGSTATNSFQITIQLGRSDVFYRLSSP